MRRTSSSFSMNGVVWVECTPSPSSVTGVNPHRGDDMADHQVASGASAAELAAGLLLVGALGAWWGAGRPAGPGEGQDDERVQERFERIRARMNGTLTAPLPQPV